MPPRRTRSKVPSPLLTSHNVRLHICVASDPHPTHPPPAPPPRARIKRAEPDVVQRPPRSRLCRGSCPTARVTADCPQSPLLYIDFLLFASWMLAGQCKPPSHPPSKPPRIDAALARNPARLASCRPDCRCLGQRPRWLFTTGKLPPRLRLLLQRGTATQTRREPSRGGKARMVASRRRLAPFPHPNPRPDSNQR